MFIRNSQKRKILGELLFFIGNPKKGGYFYTNSKNWGELIFLLRNPKKQKRVGGVNIFYTKFKKKYIPNNQSIDMKSKK